jgi:hypothetical protein
LASVHRHIKAIHIDDNFGLYQVITWGVNRRMSQLWHDGGGIAHTQGGLEGGTPCWQMRLINHGGVEKGLNVLYVCINWLHEGTPKNDSSN